MRTEVEVGAVAGGLAGLVLVAAFFSSYQGAVAAVWMLGGALSLLYVISGGPVRPWAADKRRDAPAPGPVSSYATKVEGAAKGASFFQSQIARLVVSSGVPADGAARELLDPPDDGEGLKGEAYLEELEAALRGARDD